MRSKEVALLPVGATSAVRALAGPQTKTLDADGRTVILGLIDNHTHLIRAARDWWREARLDGVATQAEALEIIKAIDRDIDRILYTSISLEFVRV